MTQTPIRLTQFSHGAGCGCKIAPGILDEILRTNIEMPDEEKLLVGNHSKDDAAVYSLGNGMALISTTDFFMPIVDDPYTFGRIAAANAISDVYAMGGRPVLAIAILGWPVDKLPPEVAREVVEGGRATCREAGIPLAGGHSIDTPEPIFGLAVNGLVSIENIKTNQAAQAGDKLFLTKPLGVGILTTAEKKGLLKKEHADLAAKQMLQLNTVGETLGKLAAVHSITDVTGFGLFGHLLEMMEASNCSAVIDTSAIHPIVPDWKEYISAGSIPGGTHRNWKSYGHQVGEVLEEYRVLLSDPQTSGGLLISIAPESVSELTDIFRDQGLDRFTQPIGEVLASSEKRIFLK